MLLSLFSCTAEPSAESMLRDFLYSYGVEGIIYSPDTPEGGEGYITEELFRRIYLYDGDLPTNCAIFLNPRTDDFVECAIFVARDEDERAAISDMCIERVSILDTDGDRAFIIRSGRIIFYSTLKDKDRAEEIITKILKSPS